MNLEYVIITSCNHPKIEHVDTRAGPNHPYIETYKCVQCEDSIEVVPLDLGNKGYPSEKIFEDMYNEHR